MYTLQGSLHHRKITQRDCSYLWTHFLQTRDKFRFDGSTYYHDLKLKIVTKMRRIFCRPKLAPNKKHTDLTILKRAGRIFNNLTDISQVAKQMQWHRIQNDMKYTSEQQLMLRMNRGFTVGYSTDDEPRFVNIWDRLPHLMFSELSGVSCFSTLKVHQMLTAMEHKQLTKMDTDLVKNCFLDYHKCFKDECDIQSKKYKRIRGKSANAAAAAANSELEESDISKSDSKGYLALRSRGRPSVRRKEESKGLNN